MKITVFQSDKGDCLLLTGQDGKRLLADGGMRDSFKRFVRPALGELCAAGQPLDLVYLSHIDLDHIGGVLQLMDDTVAWRVYDYQSAQGNSQFKKPKFVRPPQITAIWHNAFKDLVEDNQGEIESQLAIDARLMNLNTQLKGEAKTDLKQMALACSDLVNGVREGLLLSNRVGSGQLNIPLNPEFAGGLIYADDAPPAITLGGMQLLILGPFKEDLLKLRQDWNDWLEAHQQIVADLRREAEDDAANLPMDEGALLLSAMLSLAAKLGDRTKVTLPNLASLMLLVEEAGKTVLMTGDGHAKDILKGLAAHGRLDGNGKMHVDVLKVQHHGSEHNIDDAFCKAVTADHYIFCGNGAHQNPDLAVLKLLIETRLADGGTQKFKLWFNSSVQMAGSDANAAHMQLVQDLVGQYAAQSHGRLTVRFLKAGAKFELDL